jgi:dUTP pyrophosphatase
LITVKTSKKMKILYKKVRKVKSPSRGTSESAGLDLYIPEGVIQEDSFGELQPGESMFIPSGLEFHIPNNYALVAFNKSGVAVKQGLQVGACVIDSDYTGEVHIHVTNVTNKTVKILPQQKIIQLLMCPVVLAETEEVEVFFREKESERKDRGFGSTGL